MFGDLPVTVRIAERVVESDQDVTLYLPCDLDFAPGQFFMIWIPGIGEKPFSIAGKDDRGLILTIRRRGPFSSLLADTPAGELVGVRGPFGKGFSLEPKCCIVGGGVGIASVASVADVFPDAPILYGENTASSRMYRERYPDAGFYTVDGSEGIQGYPTNGLAPLLESNEISMVYCCGPEPLIQATVRHCEQFNVRCEAAIERYMKCGMGVCGACACGSLRVCADGPVFDGAELVSNPDFGKRSLDASGTWHTVSHPAA